jgi:CubicO group peptidase (beta-lactamase class C family)
LEKAERSDLDAVTFPPLGSKTPMTWADSLTANYTDGIVVLHRGRIVYERYFGVLTPERQHIAFSVTKSFFGTLAAMLIAEGKIDPDARVTRYVPELANSAFGDATVGAGYDHRARLRGELHRRLAINGSLPLRHWIFTAADLQQFVATTVNDKVHTSRRRHAADELGRLQS